MRRKLNWNNNIILINNEDSITSNSNSNENINSNSKSCSDTISESPNINSKDQILNNKDISTSIMYNKSQLSNKNRDPMINYAYVFLLYFRQ